MKDLLIGMVVGVVTGYVLRKMEDDGKFRCLHANLHHLASKAKEEAMNLKDAGLDKVEYRYSWDANNEDERRSTQILLIISKITCVYLCILRHLRPVISNWHTFLELS